MTELIEAERTLYAAEARLADPSELTAASANLSKARRALAGVETYAYAGGAADPAEPLGDILVDLLTDLAHLAHVTGQDYEALTESAARMAATEIAEAA
jgi:hypothetical protein